MAITAEQITQYLASQGMDGVPPFIVDAWIDELEAVAECLADKYSASRALLIQLYLLSLLALSQADKYISSQTAPNGASRSFRYGSFADRWSGQLALLRKADTFGCVDELIPAQPGALGAGLWVSTGGCRMS